MKRSDPYSVRLHRNKLLMALLDDATNHNQREAIFCSFSPLMCDLRFAVGTHSRSGTVQRNIRTQSPTQAPKMDVGTFELSKAAATEAAEGTTTTVGALQVFLFYSVPCSCAHNGLGA